MQPFPHYPFVTRLLLQLIANGDLPDVQSVDIEPDYGIVGRIVYRDGSVRLYRSTNVGINNHGASVISKDKGYTKYFLQRLGYATPRGNVFMLPTFATAVEQRLSRYGKTSYTSTNQIYAYIEDAIGYPCFIKPNDGSGGHGVKKCFTPVDVQAIITEYQRENMNLLLVEEAIAMPDYRVIVLRDQCICCYRRIPLSVTGDGISTIRELLHGVQAALTHAGRRTHIDPMSTRIAENLHRSNRTLDSVPQASEIVPINDVSNMSAGGIAEDCTDSIHSHWQNLCIRITADMGLTLCGVDIACADITDPHAAYSILEINGSPGLGNYAALGDAQAARVYDLYRDVFERNA